jgi:arylsulfatase A-like enzyme
MGYHDLGCFGSKTILTPNIDQMCAAGIKFTDCYSGDTVCAPARSTLMTGYHKGRTPVRGNSGGIPLFPEDVTVAEVLKNAGYATGGFGKWGLGNQGKDGAAERQGFDLFFGYYNQWHAHTSGKRAIRMGKWKGLGMPGQIALYDLSNDISEENDLAAQHPDIVKQLSDYMSAAEQPPRSQQDDGKYTGRPPKPQKRR